MGKISDFFKRKVSGKNNQEKEVQPKEKSTNSQDPSDEKLLKIVDLMIEKPGVMNAILVLKKYKSGEISRKELEETFGNSEKLTKIDDLMTLIFNNKSTVKPIVDEMIDVVGPFIQEHPEMYYVANAKERYLTRMQLENVGFEEHKRIAEDFCSDIAFWKSEEDRSIEFHIRVTREYDKLMREEAEMEEMKKRYKCNNEFSDDEPR